MPNLYGTVFEFNPRVLGGAIALALFLTSMGLVNHGRRVIGLADEETNARAKFMKRAHSLGWLSWSNLALQGSIVAVGLTIADKDTALGIAVMIGFIVAILSMAYRYVLRLSFFMYSRSDALFILEKRGRMTDGMPSDMREFARLAKLLFPEDSSPQKGGAESALKALVDAFKK